MNCPVQITCYLNNMVETAKATDSVLPPGKYTVKPRESLILYAQQKAASEFHSYAESVPEGEHVNVLETPEGVVLKLRSSESPGVIVEYNKENYLTAVGSIGVACEGPKSEPAEPVPEP